MKPRDLLYALQDIITEEAKCKGAWLQHPGPLTNTEILRIAFRATELFQRLNAEAAGKEASVHA